ncbi:MAG TPA: alkaline phosphatase family protein [Polyangiaceae bacterium]|nr:alkaline phosphatase family protein [Polyangiaceae bacterium]
MGASASAPVGHGHAPPPPLVVVLVVDQLAAWLAAERLPLLPADGGFARLRREGLSAELRYQHATTSTAPGHAALFTGLPPRGSGVYANERPDPVSRKAVSIFADEASKLVLDDIKDVSSSSGHALLVPTLADALLEQHPSAEIVAISLKDRASIAASGQTSATALWFDGGRGVFVTSSAFASKLPSWVTDYNAKLGTALSRSWTLLVPAWVAEHAETPDAQPGEGDVGLGNTFPHDLSKAAEPARVFRTTPMAEEVLLELSLLALSHTDAGRTRLLAVSLSAFDYIGHVYGPESWESWDELRRLDRSLALFFHALDQQGPYSVLLTGDHGSPPLPETAGMERARPWCSGTTPDRFQRPCARGERLFRAPLEKRARDSAKGALGAGDWILAVVEPFVYYTEAARTLDSARRGRLDAAVIAALGHEPGVARVIPLQDVPQVCPGANDESIDALVCRSLSGRAGELYIVTQPGSFFDAATAPGHGINHGSPHLYDRSVPLFVRDAERKLAGKALARPVSPTDFVRTAAALLGIEPPPGGVGGRSLLE